VLCGGESRLYTGRKTVPDTAEIETEQTLFMTIMEEGVERPTTSRQLQFALETVIHAHSNRSFRFHPRVNRLFHRRVRYLLGKGQESRISTTILREPYGSCEYHFGKGPLPPWGELRTGIWRLDHGDRTQEDHLACTQT
jgi:hypothetical protein